jgi:hypothetical protein
VEVTEAEFEIQNLPLSNNDSRWQSATYYTQDAAARAALKVRKYVRTTTYAARTYTMTYTDTDPAISVSAILFLRGR